MAQLARVRRIAQDKREQRQRATIWQKCGATSHLEKIAINGKIRDMASAHGFPLRRPWGSFPEEVRVALRNQLCRDPELGVRYDLSKRESELMLKTICRDVGRNKGASRRNALRKAQVAGPGADNAASDNYRPPSGHQSPASPGSGQQAPAPPFLPSPLLAPADLASASPPSPLPPLLAPTDPAFPPEPPASPNPADPTSRLTKPPAEPTVPPNKVRHRQHPVSESVLINLYCLQRRGRKKKGPVVMPQASIMICTYIYHKHLYDLS